LVIVRSDTIGREDVANALSDNTKSSGAIDRKLKALTAVLLDPAATEAEKANADALKARLEKRLSREAARPTCTKAALPRSRQPSTSAGTKAETQPW
jgi:hypothetical protein